MNDTFGAGVVLGRERHEPSRKEMLGDGETRGQPQLIASFQAQRGETGIEFASQCEQSVRPLGDEPPGLSRYRSARRSGQ